MLRTTLGNMDVSPTRPIEYGRNRVVAVAAGDGRSIAACELYATPPSSWPLRIQSIRLHQSLPRSAATVLRLRSTATRGEYWGWKTP
jgi:hypothetical protein